MGSLARLLPSNDGKWTDSLTFVTAAVTFGAGSGVFIGLVVAPTAQPSDLAFLWPCCRCPDVSSRQLFLESFRGPAPPTLRTAVANFWDVAVHPVRACRLPASPKHASNQSTNHR